MANKISKDIKRKAETYTKAVEEDYLKLNQRFRKKWRDYYKLVRSFESGDVLPGQSNVFIPKIWEIIMKKTPAIVADDPTFVVSPRRNEAIEYLADIQDTLYFWWDSDDMRSKCEKWVKEALIYGSKIGKVAWKQDTKEVEKIYDTIDPDTGEEVQETLRETIVVEERPTFELRSIFDILVDPRAEDFDDCVGVIDVIDNVRVSDLLVDEDYYDLSDLKGKSERMRLAEGKSDEFEPQEKKELDEDAGISQWGVDVDKGTLTLKEYWGRFSPTDDPVDEDEYIITTVWQDGKCLGVIRCELNTFGFRPFVKFDDHVMDGEFYGIGEVEPLEGLQIEYNNLRNARMDFNNSINYPEWMYNLNAGINPVNLVHRPNNLIPVELPIGTDINTVLRAVEKPMPPQSGYAEEAQLNRDFQTISATMDYTDRGGSMGFANTATGVMSRDNERAVVVNNTVRHLENSISKLGTLWLRLASHFVDDELVIRRKRMEHDIPRELDQLASQGMEPRVPTLEEAPEKFTTISGEVFKEIDENYTIKIEGGSTTANSAAGRARDAINIGNLAAQFTALGVPIDNSKVFMEILKNSFHKAHPENYILQQQRGEEHGQEPIPAPSPFGRSPAAGEGEAQAPQTQVPIGDVPIQPSQPLME